MTESPGTPSPAVSRSSEPATDRGLPGKVALIVLISYVGLLAAFVVLSVVSNPDDSRKEWFELSKAGFATLGSALALILGYYFGQKQIAQEAEREKNRAIATVEQMERAKREPFIELLKSQSTESQPDELSRANLPSGRPQRAPSEDRP